MAEIHVFQVVESMQNNISGRVINAIDLDSNHITSEKLIKSYNIPNYMSFDGEGINLNNSRKRFYSRGDYYGYISNTVSDENCSCKYSSIQLDVPNTFDFSKGITISFYGNCCREIYVKYNFSDATSDFESFEVETSIFHFYPSKRFWNVTTSMEIIFTQTTLPNQFIKVANVKFGEITVLDKLKNIELLEEINVLSDDLPINSLNFSFISKDKLLAKKKSPMNLYSNGEYYGTFYLDEIERTGKEIYEVKSFNCVKKLDESQYKEWFLGITLERFKNDISNISNTRIEIPYNIRAFGNIPVDSCRYAICQFAFANRMMVSSSRSDAILLKPIPQIVSSIIKTSDKRIIGEAKYSKSKTISSSKIKYAISYDVDMLKVDTIQLNNPANERIIYLFEEPVEVLDDQPEGVTIYSHSNNYVDFVSTQENISLNVFKIRYLYNNATITNDLYYGFDSNEKDFSKLDLRGVYFNEEGWGTDQIERKISDIKKYMISDGTISAKIILKGEKVGDLIQIETAFDGIKTGIIKSMSISFGYDDVAEIEVLEWPIG